LYKLWGLGFSNPEEAENLHLRESLASVPQNSKIKHMC